MRRLVIAIVALLLLPAVASAQGGKVLRIGWAQDPATLNPFVGLDEEDYSVWAMNWDLLVNFDPETLEPAPGIAESWDVSPDGKTVTFHLADAEWSDGKPVTSEDVKWSLETLGSEGALFTGYTTNIESIETPDEKTVVLHAKQPDARFVGGLFVYILPKHIWGKVPIKELTGSYKPELPLVGSGPYITTEQDRGRIVRMRRNPTFRGAPGAYDEIQWIKYGNQDAVERALTLGEIDLVREASAGGFKQLGTKPDVETRRAPTPAYTQLAFNSCTPENCSDEAKFNPAIQDPAVRQAIAFAIDREKLQAIATRGTSFVANGILPSYYKSFYTEPDETYPLDVEKANQLLDDAGWVPGDDGVREKDGQKLEFNLYARSESGFTVQMAKLIAEMTEEIGVKFDVQVVSTDKLTDLTIRRVDGKPAPEFDTFIWGWGGDPYDPSFLLSILTTQAISDQSSDSFYSNPEYDRLYEEQATIFDTEKRREVIAQMINMTQRDLPYLVLTEDPKLQAYRTDRISQIAPVCPAETGDLFCDQVSWGGVTALKPLAAASTSSADSPTGSTGLGLVIGLGIGALFGAFIARRRYRAADEPLEEPG